VAPEVIQRANYDFKADVWSLGITMYEMATGNPPFAELDPRRAVFLIPRSKTPQLQGNWSNSMIEFLNMCLQENPNDVGLNTKD
jgi:serine/threonine protein kinase